MTHHPVFELSVVFALVTGTGAALFAALDYWLLRTSPFGRSVLVLGGVMGLFTTYHATLVVTHGETPATHALETALYTALLLFVGVTILVERRLETAVTDA